MSSYLMMESLSDTYGWTPSQIKSLTVAEVKYYWEILRMKAKLQNAQIKKNKK